MCEKRNGVILFSEKAGKNVCVDLTEYDIEIIYSNDLRIPEINLIDKKYWASLK